MAIFNDLRSRASGLAQDAASRTKQAAQSAKLNLAISQEQEKIKKAYTELGKLYYADFQTDTAPEGTEYLLWVGKINTAKARIEALRLELNGVKGISSEIPAGPIPGMPEASTGPDLSEIQLVVLDEDAPADDKT